MQVYFFDGEVARRRPARLERVGETFLLVETERRHGPFDFADLRPVGSARGSSYAHATRGGWRIDLVEEAPEDIAARLPRPRRYGGWIDAIGLWRASAAFLAVSAAVVAVVLTAPQWLAPIIPASAERQLGEALVGDLGGRRCRTPAGDAALAKLTGKLDANPGDLDIGVANFAMVNAAALPGGKVFIFRGLLDTARSPAEVAGVLGHEIGHVRERHVMAALLRQLGLSIFLAGADSNVSGTLGSALSLSYSRDAERAADDHAIAVMAKANIDPKDTADFFQRMAGPDLAEKRPEQAADEADDENRMSLRRLGEYLSSHPVSAERRDAFLAGRKAASAYQSPLTPAEWRALRRICADDPDVKSGESF